MRENLLRMLKPGGLLAPATQRLAERRTSLKRHANEEAVTGDAESIVAKTQLKIAVEILLIKFGLKK